MNNLNEQKEFLYNLLSSFETRRSSIDTRATIILAASSLLVGLVFSQIKKGEFLSTEGNITYKIIIIIIILFFVASLVYSLLLVAPINRSKKEKKKFTRSLSFFYLIADETVDDYHEEIRKQSLKNIVKELSKQTVLISRLLKKRYDRLERACKFLYGGIFIMLTYCLIRIIF